MISSVARSAIASPILQVNIPLSASFPANALHTSCAATRSPFSTAAVITHWMFDILSFVVLISFGK